MKRNIKYWFVKVFKKDVELQKRTFLYLFFSFCATVLIVEFFILKFFAYTRFGFAREIPLILILLVISLLFLVSGFIVDFIMNKTRLNVIVLLICLIGLFLIIFRYPLTDIIGFFILLISLPHLIVVWFSTLVHETNILNRGRITAMFLISCFLIGLVGLVFIFFEDLFIFFVILESILFVIIVWCSRTYKYSETKDRLKSEKKYLKLIFERHFSRYSIGLTFLSGLLGGLFYNTLAHFKFFDIDIITFSIVSFFYIIIAGWSFDNIGRKNTLIIGILIASFFYISHGSFYIDSIEYIFGIPKKIHISIHYAIAVIPLLFALITISGDFSTERGNLKYRGRINGLFIALMCLGIALGYLLYRGIDVLYKYNPNMEIWMPNLPILLNSFVIVVILAWMMAGKDMLVSKERNWASAIKELYVLSYSGVCVYNYDFLRKSQPKEKENKREIDEDLISGALSGIITIISEITQSKRYIKKIDKEGNHLLFSFGKFHIVALITTNDLPILYKKLETFSGAFEQKFSKELKKFQGNIQPFQEAKYLVKKYFSQKYATFTE